MCHKAQDYLEEVFEQKGRLHARISIVTLIRKDTTLDHGQASAKLAFVFLQLATPEKD